MNGATTSGIEPMEFNVLVKPYEVEEKTAGGLLIPEQHRERVQWSETRGTVVAVAPLAFSDLGQSAEPGDDVLFAKHAGEAVKGLDGVEYRMLKDKDVLARLNAEGAA